MSEKRKDTHMIALLNCKLAWNISLHIYAPAQKQLGGNHVNNVRYKGRQQANMM